MAEVYPSFYFGFGLLSDSSVNYDGVYIDDVQLIRESIAISSYSYGYMSGTSMATPHVAGLAGLIKAANPSYTYAQIKETIMTTVDPKTSLSGRVFTGGRINAYNALSTPGRLLAPTSLSASAVTGYQINLSWTDNSLIETGYRIERKTEGGAYTQIATAGTNATSYSDSSVSANTTYYYRIRAYNSTGDSSYSNEASARTPAPPDSGGGGGGCGVIDSNKNSQPPITGMMLLLLPLAWLLLRRFALKRA
ncbi:MAG: S8 family serine peptidase [Nitrospirae bacterium]|nr:S8 family serine peptidase [Nitrospirota bacterium]